MKFSTTSKILNFIGTQEKKLPSIGGDKMIKPGKNERKMIICSSANSFH